MRLKKFITITCILFSLVYNFAFASSNLTPEEQEIALLENNILALQQKLEVLKEQQRQKKINNNPKVGLVLSGGGAKGLAHIGVLKELEKNNIKVDFITGTSMGAVIGALYSVGYTPDEIEKLMYTIDFDSIFKNTQTDRQNLPLEKKVGNSQDMLTLKYDNNLHFYLPKSLNNTNNMYFIFKKLFWNFEGFKDFDKFPIPLRVIATDINTGEAKAFSSGDLSRILTASVAIPTIFSPVKIGNSEYIDGMMARNFPVQDALDMGADIVIGSDVGVILKDENKEFDIMSTFSQILALSSAKSSPKQRQLSNIVISPDVNNISPTDFSNIDSVILKGNEAAALSIEKIKTAIGNEKILANSSNSEVSNKENISVAVAHPTVIFNNIYFKNENIDEKNKDIIFDLFEKYKGKNLEKKEFDSILKNVQALNSVDKIYYEFDEKDESIVIDVIESPSNSVGLTGNYRSDYGTTFKVNTDVFVSGKIGSTTNLSAKFGDYYGLALNNFSYYGTEDKIGFFSALSFNQSPLHIYRNNDKLAKYVSNDLEFLLGLSSQVNNKLLVSYGVSFNASDLNLETGNDDYEYIDFYETYGNTFFNISYDTLDNIYVPTSGTKGDFIYTWGGSVFSEENINYYGPIYSVDTHLKATKKLSFYAGMSGGSVSGDSILPTKYLKIGGIKDNLKRTELSFAGYHYQNILAEDAFIGTLGFNYNLIHNLYFISKYNIGTFSPRSGNLYDQEYTLWDNSIQGVEAGFSYMSFILPMSLTLSKNDSQGSELLLQFSVGYFID